MRKQKSLGGEALNFHPGRTLDAKVRRACEYTGLRLSDFLRMASNYYADLLLQLPPEDAPKIGAEVKEQGAANHLLVWTPLRPEPIRPSASEEIT